ncbi:MAG: hypothetical protein OEV65_18440 [Aquincola sp.]|nr:hypothetical protein [Aquincola sp.]
MNPRSRPRFLGACATLLALTLGACSSLPPTQGPTLSSARIAEIVAGADRTAADRTNDQRRKPKQMLAFIGLRAGMVALDVSAAGGYTTELLARAIGPGGTVYGQSLPRDPNRAPVAPAAPEGNSAPSATPAPPAPPPSAGPPRSSVMALAARAERLRGANVATAAIVAVPQPFENPAPAALAANGLDLVTLMFNYHDLGFMGVDRAQMNRALFQALKPGGLYVIADHSGRAGTGISESGTLHRIEEVFLRREVEAAGFRLVAEGQFMRNPNDPRDKNTPDPPMPKDEFVLKFVKP